MRHVTGSSLRAAVAVACLVALTGCVPQPPAGSERAGGTASASRGAVASGRPTAPTRSGSAARTPLPAVISLGALPPSGFDVPAPDPVLDALADAAPAPTAEGLARRLDALLSASDFGDRVEYDIADAATGRSILSRGASTPVTPASTTKLLTAVAALSVLGPQERLVTRVVSADGGASLVLVGGGDALLTGGRGKRSEVVGHAGLADLADATATALRAAGRDRVALRVDDTLFTGAAISDGWAESDLAAGFVAPIAPLAVESGRATEGAPAEAADPALAAVGSFERLLEDRGVTVSLVARGKAPRNAVPVAEVRGAHLHDVVEHMLDESDNTVAEVLARLVATRTGRPATFDGAADAVLAAVGKLGVPTTGARFSGGSGLARDGVIAPRTLTRTLVVAASKAHPELRATITGLPVAGVSGTLAERYTADNQDRAVGVVRAKTGTLTGASSLAGTVVDADGRMLAFAVVADRVGSTVAARDALDTVAAALAGCGCS